MTIRLRKIERIVGNPDLPCAKAAMLRFLNEFGYLLPHDSPHTSPWDAETMAVLALGPSGVAPSGSIAVTVGFSPDGEFVGPGGNEQGAAR